MRMIRLIPRAFNSRNHNFVGNKALNSVSWKLKVDIIDAAEYANCSVTIIHKSFQSPQPQLLLEKILKRVK